jgi:hypothetical protein
MHIDSILQVIARMYILMGFPLDPVGNISLILQVVILFLLILGFPLVRGGNTIKNLMLHGYLTIVALVLHTALIFIVMVPTVSGGFNELSGLSIFYSFTVWSHIILGTAAEVLAIIIIAPWLYKHPSQMACAKMKKWMLPTFIIWVIAIVNGTLIHITGML